MKLLILALVTVALSGCSGYLQMIEGLNRRQVQSCLEYNGSARVGALSGGSGALRGVTVTGGASLSDCVNFLRGDF